MCIFLKCWQPLDRGFSIKRKESVMKLKELPLIQGKVLGRKTSGLLRNRQGRNSRRESKQKGG